MIHRRRRSVLALMLLIVVSLGAWAMARPDEPRAPNPAGAPTPPDGSAPPTEDPEDGEPDESGELTLPEDHPIKHIV
ncbi:MAG: hypothetical protein ACRDKZ_09200, partial [Actinomycetota bacterium]